MYRYESSDVEESVELFVGYLKSAFTKADPIHGKIVIQNHLSTTTASSPAWANGLDFAVSNKAVTWDHLELSFAVFKRKVDLKDLANPREGAFEKVVRDYLLATVVSDVDKLTFDIVANESIHTYQGRLLFVSLNSAFEKVVGEPFEKYQLLNMSTGVDFVGYAKTASYSLDWSLKVCYEK